MFSANFIFNYSINRFVRNHLSLLFCIIFSAMQGIAVADNLNNKKVLKLKTLNTNKKSSSVNYNNINSKCMLKHVHVQRSANINTVISLNSNIQSGYVIHNESNNFEYKDLNKKQGKQRYSNDFVLNNNIIFQAEGKEEEIKLKYGIYVKVNVAPRKPKDIYLTENNVSNIIGDKMMIFLEGSLGRLEAGNYDGAHDIIKISGSSVAKATGGIAGDWNNWLNSKAYYADTTKVNNSLINLVHSPISRDYIRANKITYYMPRVNKFTFGISYIPNITKKYTKAVKQIEDSISILNREENYKDIIGAAIKYNAEVDCVDWNISAMTEFGEVKREFYNNMNATSYKNYNISFITEKSNIFSWEIGTKFNYKKIFSLAYSYGNFSKSSIAKELRPQISFGSYKYDRNYWTTGINYSYKNFDISVTYMQSQDASFVIDQPKAIKQQQYAALYNKANILSIGMDYLMFSGFLPYAEVTHFNYKKLHNNNIENDNGILFLLGVKLRF